MLAPGGSERSGACPRRPRGPLARLPRRSADHHPAGAAPSRAPGGAAAGVGGARHLARRPDPCLTMDNLPHAFTAIACTHAVSRERPSGLALTVAVLAANASRAELAPREPRGAPWDDALAGRDALARESELPSVFG